MDGGAHRESITSGMHTPGHLFLDGIGGLVGGGGGFAFLRGFLGGGGRSGLESGLVGRGGRGGDLVMQQRPWERCLLDKGGRCLTLLRFGEYTYDDLLFRVCDTHSGFQDEKNKSGAYEIVNYLAWTDRTPVNLVTEKREESSDTGAPTPTLW